MWFKCMRLQLWLCCGVGLLGVQTLFAQPTSLAIDHPAPASAVHPRSTETARWFDRAQAILVRAIFEVERAKYADELPSFKSFAGVYFQEIDYSSYEKNWVRANYPCLQKLNTLAWLKNSVHSSYGTEHRLRFARGEKPQLLAELNAHLDSLKIMRGSCMEAAPHYYSDGNFDHVLGDFIDLKPSGSQLMVRLRTPLMTDQILLYRITSTASKNPRIANAIAKWIDVHCADTMALAVMSNELRSSASRPSESYLKPMLGNVSCGGKPIEIALLAAGLANIDLSRDISPDSHPTWFAALREARAAKLGIWATADTDLLLPQPQAPKPLISPALLAPPTSSGAVHLCMEQAAWKLRAVVEADLPGQRREYLGVLCLSMPSVGTSTTSKAMQTTPIRGTSHWNCCPGARSDVMVGAMNIDANGQKSITLTRMLAAPHELQTYTGMLYSVAGAPAEQLSIVGTWTQAGMADGVLRSFVATPLNRHTFDYANPWRN